MKSLREYLLAEAKNDNENKTPKDYMKITLQGGLTGHAKQMMGGSYKEGITAAATEKGRDQILEKLKGSGGDTIRKIIESVVTTPNDLDSIFVAVDYKRTESISGMDGIAIKLNPTEWPQLAGKKSSSMRLLRFWLESTLIAYGYQKKGVVFSISEADNIITIIN